MRCSPVHGRHVAPSYICGTLCWRTSGVSGVDDAEDTGIAVLPRCVEGLPELSHVQTPTLVFIQVVINLHGTQVCQRGGVQRVLGDGDHDTRTGRTLTAH